MIIPDLKGVQSINIPGKSTGNSMILSNLQHELIQSATLQVKC